ncbi:FlgD immunoglobulin-like domain containing protein [Candidatus Eisenbacteria bacterium]|uniref:FlgD immunoglobulin-like domain containing protein n=1 Tax=Eiseniibacteriota bacterium TaxID=2212470 RepID=A0ABV6YNT0_UNCEI
MRTVKPTTFLGLSTVVSALLLVCAVSVLAQDLIAYDDEFGIPLGLTLEVEAFGVLDNDILDGENAGELGATAELVADVIYGTLLLNSDGSFTYSPGATFDGMDIFSYRAVFGAALDTAIVTLTACTGGPDVFVCWNESAFLAKAGENGYNSFQEGFEDDVAWGAARSPNTAASVISQGVRWQSNHPGSPDFNEITTGPGPARTGQWAVFDPEHGSAEGTPAQCDIDNPPEHCLYHDGFTGILEPGIGPLQGVGGYITGIYGANVGIVLDDLVLFTAGHITGGHQFFGVIDTRPGGFTRFEFRELDGKIGQALYIFGDDFTMLSSAQVAVQGTEPSHPWVFFAGAEPNPSSGTTTLHFSLPARAGVRLNIYDTRGRLVRGLVDESREAGAHSIRWDGRDESNVAVSAGVYFGRLIVNGPILRDVQVRKISVAR